MKTRSFSILCIFILCCKIAASQEYIPYYNNSRFYIVTAKNNLNLREHTETNSKIITSIPAGQLIYCTGDTNQKWLNAFYNGKEGFVSAEYLRLYEYQPYVIFTEKSVLHEVSEAKQGDEYIGVFNSENNDESFYLKKINIKYKKEQAMWDEAKDSSLFNLIFEDKKPLFIFKGIPIKNFEELIYGKYFSDIKFVYPGETVSVKISKEHYSSFYAVGNLVANLQNANSQIFNSIINYQLRNRFYLNKQFFDELVFKDENIYYWNDEHIISRYLIWAGDLDKDNKIDYLFWHKSDKGACYGISFHLSSWAENGYNTRQVFNRGYCGD